MAREKMSQSYEKRTLPNWHLNKPSSEKMRKE
jgi:hypothetical protein